MEHIINCLGACDFESTITRFCTWSNFHQGDDFDWLVGSGNTYYSAAPQTDNTLGTSQGNNKLYCHINGFFKITPHLFMS